MIARMVGAICNGYDPESLGSALGVEISLRLYADVLDAWAERTAHRMLEGVAKADERAWRERAEIIGHELSKEVRTAPTGAAYKKLMGEQVHLIRSLPLDAAQRVHEMATRGMEGGLRPDALREAILETGQVTESRARLIARTETSRAASNMTQARAEFAGSVGYIWRTSGDSDVRDSHREMRGQFVKWDDPPTLDGMTGHAGCLPNCRCYAEPVFPD